MHTEKETSTFTKKRHFNCTKRQSPETLNPQLNEKTRNDQTDGNQAEVIPKVKYRVKKSKEEKSKEDLARKLKFLPPRTLFTNVMEKSF
jgi:hypothetical protein